jgi:hypothetical protein
MTLVENALKSYFFLKKPTPTIGVMLVSDNSKLKSTNRTSKQFLQIVPHNAQIHYDVPADSFSVCSSCPSLHRCFHLPYGSALEEIELFY